MTDLSRRWFLKGTLAVAATSVIAKPSLLQGLPVLHGDGLNDDWPALQALVDFKPFVCEGEIIKYNEDAELIISGGRHLMSNTLRIGQRKFLTIRNCSFICADNFKGVGAIEIIGQST